jgi:hypothetical protein
MGRAESKLFLGKPAQDFCALSFGYINRNNNIGLVCEQPHIATNKINLEEFVPGAKVRNRNRCIKSSVAISLLPLNQHLIESSRSHELCSPAPSSLTNSHLQSPYFQQKIPAKG